MPTDPTVLRVAVLTEIVRAIGASLPPEARDADPAARDELFREFDALFAPFRV